MTYPTLIIVNGPGQRDLELAFVGRNLGAAAEFTVITQDHSRLKVSLKILNFSFVTCYGAKYKLGGQLVWLSVNDREKLPSHFNFINAEYHVEDRDGNMEFSNGG